MNKNNGTKKSTRDHVYDWNECRASFGSFNTEPTILSDYHKILGITLTLFRLHVASSVRIPHSTNHFQHLLPTVIVTPSASTFNLHGAAIFPKGGHTVT